MVHSYTAAMPLPFQPGPPKTCGEIRAVDRHAIEVLGIPGLILMENAARSAAEILYAQLSDPGAAQVVVLCGPGNNGGDGFVIARHLHLAGVAVGVIAAQAESRSGGDAAVNLGILRRLGIQPVDASDPSAWSEAARRISGASVLVDALLGTGTGGAPRGVIAELIRAAMQGGALRVAIDVPSGLDADSGRIAEPCFRADLTITFVAEKVGFSSADAGRVLGRVVVTGIGAPPRAAD